MCKFAFAEMIALTCLQLSKYKPALHCLHSWPKLANTMAGATVKGTAKPPALLGCRRSYSPTKPLVPMFSLNHCLGMNQDHAACLVHVHICVTLPKPLNCKCNWVALFSMDCWPSPVCIPKWTMAKAPETVVLRTMDNGRLVRHKPLLRPKQPRQGRQ